MTQKEYDDRPNDSDSPPESSPLDDRAVFDGRTIRFPNRLRPTSDTLSEEASDAAAFEEAEAQETENAEEIEKSSNDSHMTDEPFCSFFQRGFEPDNAGEDRRFERNFQSFFDDSGEESSSGGEFSSDAREEENDSENDLSIDEFVRLQEEEAVRENLDAASRQESADTLFVLGKKYEQAPEDAEGIGESDEEVPLTPATILEAMLFVGDRDNRSLPISKATELLRNVSESEAMEAIDALNRRYETNGSPYRIEEDADGFRMVLRSELESVRERFFGKTREVRLSQKAIDVLALIAYRQPIAPAEIQAERPGAAPILNQLLKRGLVVQEQRSVDKKQVTYYRTAERFLKLLDIDSLDDLPIVDEIDYR